MDTKSQNSNMLLAFLTLTGVIAIVALVGFFMLRKGPEIIQGQAEVTEYRVSRATMAITPVRVRNASNMLLF